MLLYHVIGESLRQKEEKSGNNATKLMELLMTRLFLKKKIVWKHENVVTLAV